MTAQPSATDGMEAFLLLSFLSGAVEKDAGLPGFKGSVAVGVKGEGDAVWWRARFADRGTAELVDRQPADADAWLCVSPEQAIGIMTGALQELPEQTVFGDRILLKKFITRYLKKQSGLSLRAQQAQGNGKGN